MMGPQHLFMYNVLEEQWKRIQEELKKRGGGNRFLIEQLLRSIRESVHGEDEHRVHYKDALRKHEVHRDDVRKEMKEVHEETKGIFAGGAGKLYRPGIFGKRRSVTTVARKKSGKPVMYPTGEHIPEEKDPRRIYSQ